MLLKYYEVTQELHSSLSPHVNKHNIRHPGNCVMSYMHTQEPPLEGEAEYVRDGVGDAEQIGIERTGVTHLVHAWHQQAHKVWLSRSSLRKELM